ncbi:MAG: carbon-nitrogen hydrolase family protein [Chloroflexota bacterium]|nr:carbon-nitrogen hydrolase family protein [Chloroflexota bacterium]
MPKSPAALLLWRAQQESYELHVQGRLERSFRPEDEEFWQHWLETHTSFSFQGQYGRIAVRKEARTRGTSYWYAYHTRGRHTHKRYLGKTSYLTIPRLEEVVIALATFPRSTADELDFQQEEDMHITVVAGQFPVTLDIQRNLEHIVSIMQSADADELVVLPEGAVSGYADDISFLKRINIHLLEDALTTLADIVQQRSSHLIVGSCLFEDGSWFNAGLYFSPDRERSVYRKVNLATHERGAMTAGTELPVFPMHFAHTSVNVGIQLCREIRFPEQWRALAYRGADLFAYLTNATNPGEHLSVWRSHLVSRAAENQLFVVSANTAHPLQHCPTMIISPRGEVLREVVSDRTETLRQRISLVDNANWYLNQCRTDLVNLTYQDQRMGLE